MDSLLLMTAVFIGYLICYHIYGKFISKKIFAISPDTKPPSVEFEDGIDYVPTRKEIIFGHHFTSISGTGPIVGPAIAIIWGWLPAILWIFLGSIFMGAVHDFGTLIISMRHQGKSISEVTAKYVNKRTRILFFLIVFLELWIVIAIFGLIIAIIFNIFASSVFPVWLQIPIALYLGHLIYHKKKNSPVLPILAVTLMYITIIAGNYLPIKMPDILGIPATGIWTIILLIYAYFASVLPVTTLLQPRDFINAYQLIIAMGLLSLGIIFSSLGKGLPIVAPSIQLHPMETPSLWPLLFITIACGAISGFHSLVSSGTSAKQVSNEKDALFVGYGSMLVEGFLATLVIIAVAAGIGMGYQTSNGEIILGIDAWTKHYASWAAADGLSSKINAFVIGSANMIASLGITHSIAVVIIGVFIASFAGTTLDTATRIQRYVISELATDLKINILSNRYLATFIAIVTAAFLAFITGADGKGALILWPLFGAVNQTLAALALIIITLYLKAKGGIKWLLTGLPAAFMAIMTLWATIINQIDFFSQQNPLLETINAAVLIIVVWIIVEGLLKFIGTNK
jgi:carbon starvation protein